MAWLERSYGGKMIRPKPEVYIADDNGFGAIVTPWGPRHVANRVIEILRDHTMSARQDLEATSPFQKLSCLSASANSLRVALMLANDYLYRDDNKSEFVAGVEVLVFAKFHNELSIAQVGAPSLMLARQGMPLLPLCTQIDLSTEMSGPSRSLAPLPSNLLGLHSTTNLTVLSVRVQPDDHLIFLSHSFSTQLPRPLQDGAPSLNTITETLAKQSPELPFWLGVLTLAD